MRKYFVIIALVAGIMTISAFDLNDILSGLKQQSGSSNESTTSTTIGDAISGILSSLTSKEVDIADITGSWKYSEPAVSFESDNLLEQAGGAAASATITSKLSPYYKKAKLNKLIIEFCEDSTFVATIGKLTANGTVTKNEDGSFTFSFIALGSIPTGSVKAFMSLSGNDLTITFDADKIMSIVKSIATVSNSTTLKTASSLLDQYEGINIGCKVTKQ